MTQNVFNVIEPCRILLY